MNKPHLMNAHWRRHTSRLPESDSSFSQNATEIKTIKSEF